MSTADEAPAVDWNALERSARATQGNAHAPYSRFHVGAALQSADGRVFSGANVENASYGLTICAERAALFAAVSAGARRFVALCVTCSGPHPPAPCGACRQVLAEFAPDFEVRCLSVDGRELRSTVAELLPHAFGARSFELD